MNGSQDLQSPQSDIPESPASNTLNRKGQRIAFLFDSTLTGKITIMPINIVYYF